MNRVEYEKRRRKRKNAEHKNEGAEERGPFCRFHARENERRERQHHNYRVQPNRDGKTGAEGGKADYRSSQPRGIILPCDDEAPEKKA